MRDTILVPLIAMLVLVAIWQLTFKVTRSTISAFITTSITLFILVFYFFSGGPLLVAYFVASGVFANAWAFALIANECSPALRERLRRENQISPPPPPGSVIEGGE